MDTSRFWLNSLKMATVLAYCQDTERRVTRIERALTRFWPGFWLVQDQLHEARTQIYDLEQHNVRLASLLVDESTNIQGRFVGIDYLADGGRVFGWPVRYRGPLQLVTVLLWYRASISSSWTKGFFGSICSAWRLGLSVPRLFGSMI